MLASRVSLLFAAAVLTAGCRADFESSPTPAPSPSPSPSPTPTPTPTPGQTVRVPFNFERDFGGWTADYADYTQGRESTIEFSATIAPVPPQVTARSGLRLSTHNRSDDVLVYVWRAVEGLVPNTRYRIDAELTTARSAAQGCPGAGGSPGEAVVVKIGAAPRQPAKTVDQRGYVLANFDRGDLLTGGSEVRTIGNIGTPGAGSCVNGVYALKSLSSQARGPVVTADASGRLWAIFATDSGFEGLTNVWLLDGSFTLSPA